MQRVNLNGFFRVFFFGGFFFYETHRHGNEIFTTTRTSKLLIGRIFSSVVSFTGFIDETYVNVRFRLRNPTTNISADDDVSISTAGRHRFPPKSTFPFAASVITYTSVFRHDEFQFSYIFFLKLL